LGHQEFYHEAIKLWVGTLYQALIDKREQDSIGDLGSHQKIFDFLVCHFVWLVWFVRVFRFVCYASND
jgi:hypothetical protein